MDPNKSFSGLDPKLQETYNRIMNTTGQAANGTPTNQVPPPVSSVQPPMTADQTQSSTLPMDPSAPVQSTSTNPYPAQPSTFATQSPSTAPIAAAQNLDLPVDKAKNASLIKILYIAGAIIFFIAYTVFWIKIFKLPIPLPF